MEVERLEIHCLPGFAMASFSAVRACFMFVVHFVVLEVLLFATAVLTAGGVHSLSFQELPS